MTSSSLALSFSWEDVLHSAAKQFASSITSNSGGSCIRFGGGSWWVGKLQREVSCQADPEFQSISTWAGFSDVLEIPCQWQCSSCIYQDILFLFMKHRLSSCMCTYKYIPPTKACQYRGHSILGHDCCVISWINRKWESYWCSWCRYIRKELVQQSLKLLSFLQQRQLATNSLAWCFVFTVR